MDQRPKQMVLERDGVSVTIGDQGDLSWHDIEAMKLQMDRWNTHHPKRKSIKKVSAEILKAILLVKKVFLGASIDDWR